MNRTNTYIITLFIFLLCSLQVKAQENKEFLITATSAGEFSLGMSIKDALKLAKRKYKANKVDNGFLVSLNEEKLLYFGRKTQEDTVGFIEIYSPKYQTKDGLRIGTPIAEAIKGKKIRMGYDGIEDEEYLAPQELQIMGVNYYNSLCLFYVKPDGDGLLGDYSLSDNEESTYNYRTDGYVTRILIYYWN